MRLRLCARRRRAVQRPLQLRAVHADRHLARRLEVLPHGAGAEAGRTDRHPQPAPVRDDDGGDAVTPGPHAASPQPNGCATDAEVAVAVDDRHLEAHRADDRQARRLAADGGHRRRAERLAGVVRAAARGGDAGENDGG